MPLSNSAATPVGAVLQSNTVTITDNSNAISNITYIADSLVITPTSPVRSRQTFHGSVTSLP